MTQQAPRAGDSTSELSIADVVDFGVAHYRKLIASACLGAMIGLGGWSLFANYQAELTLINTDGIDLVSWRAITQNLPTLAEQIAQQSSPGSTAQPSQELYRQMSDPAWWQNHARPTYALTKADIKDLAAVGDLGGAGTSILSLTMSSAGKSKELAITDVEGAAHFLRSGAAYLQVRSLLNGYESEAVATRAGIERQMSSGQIDMAYTQERLENLEALLKRFPADQKVSSQVVDPKDSGAKYLPISTQIIALNTELHQRREAQQRLSDRLTQIKVIDPFLRQAMTLQSAQFDGLALITQLLQAEQAVRATLNPADIKSRQPLDTLRSRLLAIQNRFTNGLEAGAAPTAKKRGMIKSTAAGAAVATMLALIYLLGYALVASIKRPDRKQG